MAMAVALTLAMAWALALALAFASSLYISSFLFIICDYTILSKKFYMINVVADCGRG